MADSDAIDAIIDAAAAGPAEVESDGQRVQARPLSELLDYRDRALASQGAGVKSRGLRFTRLSPPDAT